MKRKPFSGGSFSRTLGFKYKGEGGAELSVSAGPGEFYGGGKQSLGGREVGLGGKELSPIQQGRAVVGFPKIERERGEIRAAREVGVARGTLAPRQRFWGLG